MAETQEPSSESPAGSAAGGGGPSYRALFRNRSFTALWLGQVVSQSGDGIFDVALLWIVLVSTNSPGLVGLTQAAVLAPTILVGPAAGVYADRLNRRDLVVWSNVFQGVITAFISALSLLGFLSFSPLIVLVLLLYSGAEFYRAAGGAMIPRLVDRENLGVANGLFTLSTSSNQLASYTIGGVAVVAVGAAAAIVYDSLTFFLAAAVMAFILKEYGRPKSGGIVESQDKPSFWKEFRAGLSFIRSSRVFLELTVFGLLVNFFGAGLTVVIAPYVRNQLSGDASLYGIALASFSLGIIVGSVVVGRINFRAYVGKLLFAGVIAVGPMTVAIGTGRLGLRGPSDLFRHRGNLGGAEPPNPGPRPVSGPWGAPGKGGDSPEGAARNGRARRGHLLRGAGWRHVRFLRVRGDRASRFRHSRRSLSAFQGAAERKILIPRTGREV
ncbi:MAG: MFS transporter [Thaumarchaeota archaeon]|nr:MFS transporter [Nitrososphaerota archaeon]